MIADLAFAPADRHGVRRVQFIPRTSIPLGAACFVANGIRETLRELLGERCEVAIGEPVPIDREAWLLLANDAYCFQTDGKQTDVILTVPFADARRLVERAFGEAEATGDAALSALEGHALERIAARCAATFDPLCAERRGPSRRVLASALPACVAYFDVRVSSPVAVEFGIGISRQLPDPGPAGALAARSLNDVPVEVRVEFARGIVDAAELLGLARGDVVLLDTKVGAPASLKIADTLIARGTGGISGGRYSFEVLTLQNRGARS